MKTELWREYGKWLVNEMKIKDRKWHEVLYLLHDIDFSWVDWLPMDENRAKDGMYERLYFFRDLGIKAGDFDKPCSVLEMLVAFTKRVGEEYIIVADPDAGDRFDIIFLSFVRNLELTPNSSEKEVRDIVEKWLNREYSDDGWGSIMPLERVKDGYKDKEIFAQLMTFISFYDLRYWEDFERFM